MLKTIYIFGIIILFNNCSKPSEACFNFSPNENISTQIPILFDATCSKNASYYTWDFGDGTTKNSIPGTATITHSYSVNGVYEVTLIAKRKDGVTLRKNNTYSISKTIYVQ